MIQKRPPLPTFYNMGLLPLLLNMINKLSNCFESLGANQKNYVTYLLLCTSENNIKCSSLEKSSEDDIRLYASIIAYYITIDGNTTYNALRCCLNDEILCEVDAPNTPDKWFGEIACNAISKYCTDRRKAFISLNESGGWLTPDARLFLNLEPPCSHGTLACLYIPIIKRALEMFLVYFDESKVPDDSKKEIILLIVGILSEIRVDEISVQFSGLPIFLERMTCLLVVNDDSYLWRKDKIADLNEYKRKVMKFNQSIIEMTPGACENRDISTTKLSYYFEKCSKIHLKSGSNDNSIRWLELEYSKFSYYAYTRLYLTKDVVNYSFDDLYNERHSLYANDHRDLFKRDRDGYNYAYIEKYDAEMKCASDEIIRYICEKSNLYRHLYLLLITSDEEKQNQTLRILKEWIFDLPLSGENCGCDITDVMRSTNCCEESILYSQFFNEFKSAILTIGRYVNNSKNDIDLKCYKYDEFWSDLYEAFDF